MNKNWENKEVRREIIKKIKKGKKHPSFQNSLLGRVSLLYSIIQNTILGILNCFLALLKYRSSSVSSCSSGTEHLLQYREEIIFWKQNVSFAFTLYFHHNYNKAA